MKLCNEYFITSELRTWNSGEDGEITCVSGTCDPQVEELFAPAADRREDRGQKGARPREDVVAPKYQILDGD